MAVRVKRYLNNLKCWKFAMNHVSGNSLLQALALANLRKSCCIFFSIEYGFGREQNYPVSPKDEFNAAVRVKDLND